MTGYVLERRSPGLEWIRLNNSPVTGLKHAVADLGSLSKYEFRVAAVNEIGVGDFSEASELITTKSPSVPDQPRSPNVVKLVGTLVILEWTAPTTDGEISSYAVRYGVPGTDTDKYSETRVDGQTTACRLTQLKPDTKFHFAVAAVNKVGRGPWSEFSEYVVTYNQPGKLCVFFTRR